MIEDIKEAIQKNLPSMVAQELNEYIKQAEIDKQRIKEKDQKIEGLMDTLKESRNATDIASKNASKLEIELTKYKSREADIKDAETKILISKMEADRERAVSGAVMTIVDKVFSNRSFRYTEMISESKTGIGPNQFNSSISESSSKHITREGQD